MDSGQDHLHIRDFPGQLLRWATLAFTAIAYVRVDQYSVQPGVDVAVCPEGVKAGEGFCQGVLDEIFGVGVMTRHPHRLSI
jgi:hypothetical protein